MNISTATSYRVTVASVVDEAFLLMHSMSFLLFTQTEALGCFAIKGYSSCVERCGEIMDSYEDFCARILCELLAEMMREKSCSTAPARGVAHSLVCFHGRPLLSPVLSEKQRREMAEYRKRASQMDAERQIHHNKNLLSQIQTILWTDKPPKTLDMPKFSEQCLTPSPKTDSRNGFAALDNANLTPTGATEPYIFSSQQPVTPSAVQREKSAEEKQMQEETEAEGVCLQNLLKKSREFIEKDKTVDPRPSDEEHGCSLDGTASGLPFYISSANQTSPSNLTGPEPALSARPHCGRPRPISNGSVFFSFPENPNQLNITAHARPQEGKTIATQESKLLGVDNVSMGRYDDHSGLNETVGRLETSPVGPELTSPLFRRRCHTLDSHLSSNHQRPVIDRSQERMPRFVAGVTARTPTRLSPPSPMNKTFTRDSPTAAFMGSGTTPDSPFESQRNSVISTALKEWRTDEMQWQVHTLEEIQRSLEDDYDFRMSCMMAEQEREQLHLSQESEEWVRRLRGQGGLSPVAGEERCEFRVTMCPLSPGDRSPRHPVPTTGFPSTSLDVESPPTQTPIYMRGLNHSTANRNRPSQVVTVEQQRALCHLTALVKGFLIRRLLKTEKVKHLRQTIQNTQEFIRSFIPEAPQRNDSLSEKDLSLQERVRAQLRAALFDIHDIFFSWSPEERLSLLQQDRELRTERKLREMEKAKSPKDKMILSAATQKSLDRKKRVGESPGQTRRAQKTKSPPTKRSYKKTPEERVQHSERLKKQHSLG